MNISRTWLQELIDLSHYSDEALKALLNQHIIEIETMDRLVDSTPLTIGHVTSLIKHPDADKLSVCQVNVGETTEQIICGASNVRAGQKVIVALPGAILPGNFQIKKAKIRGIESSGMICSLAELGLEEKYIEEKDREGIYVLDDKAIVGTSALDYLQLNDTIYTLGLTPNRADLLSHLGLALDVSSAIKQPVKLPKPTLSESNKENPMHVSIQSAKTKRYTARVIEGVSIQPSPWWLRAKLLAAGIRPINNVVDVTNYVLMYLGQPLHAFDADKLSDTSIVVRQARNKEEVIALDEETYVLDENDVVITDGNRVIAIGGVMGGLDSSVDALTTRIVLESAHFDPTAIRNTSAKLNLRSDSSLRFERGVDPNRVILALDYAAELISKIAGGEVLMGIADEISEPSSSHKITLRKSRVSETLGVNIEDLTEVLQHLHYGVIENDDNYLLTIPSHRNDIVREQDVIEEVARMKGYDAIPATVAQVSLAGGLSKQQKLMRHTRHFLANKGLHEVLTYSLTSKAKLFEFVEENPAFVELAMPMSEERAVMRQSLLTGVVDVIEYNHSRQMDDVAIFEIGRTYSTHGEVNHLAIGLSGAFYPTRWQGQKGLADFYSLKGVFDAYLGSLGLVAQYEPLTDHKAMHPGKSANIKINQEVVGFLGQLHPLVEQNRDLQSVYVLHVNLEKVFAQIPKLTRFEPISKHPSITRDLALIVNSDVTADTIIDYMRQTGKKVLIDVSLFDVYQGQNMEEGKKSMAFSLTFQDPQKTLESSEVDALIDRILKRLAREIQATLR